MHPVVCQSHHQITTDRVGIAGDGVTATAATAAAELTFETNLAPPATLQEQAARANQAAAETAAAQERAQQEALRLSMHAHLDAVRTLTTKAEAAMLRLQAAGGGGQRLRPTSQQPTPATQQHTDPGPAEYATRRRIRHNVSTPGLACRDERS